MWKPKFYIIYPRKMIEQLQKPESWGYLCPGNLSEALQELLNVKSIGSELKLIWNHQHRWKVIEDNKIEPADLDDYLKADCSLISFKTKFLMKRAIKKLREMGMIEDVVCVGNYRDVILQQAYYKRNGKFNIVTELH